MNYINRKPKLHTADMSLNTESYLELCTVIGSIFENDDEGNFYNRVQFQSSNNGGVWAINVSSFSLPLFLEFLSNVYMEMPSSELKVEDAVVVEPPVVPLDESLEGVQTLVPEMDDKDTEEEVDDDSEETFQGLEEVDKPIRKKLLVKAATVQRVAPGVTVEDFDE